MTTTINASPTNGLVQTADGSGILKVQSNGVTTNALAWVNFNGTGTVAIRDSYNVSSITDGGAGYYTVNFTNNMSDVNYAAIVGGNTETSSGNLGIFEANLVSSFRIRGYNSAGVTADYTYVTAVVFGN